MTKEEYNTESSRIAKRALGQQRKLDSSYAKSHSNVVEGDIVTDYIMSILVDRIRYTSFDTFPECVYSGIRYTKKGVPRKDGKRSRMYQCNLKLINGEEV